MSDHQSIAAASAAVSENRTGFIVLGVLLILAGAFAMAMPFLTTIALKLFLGWLFIFTGIGQLIHAFSCQSWKGFFGYILMSILYLIAGAWLAFFPLTGILEITVFLAIMFVIEGISKFIIAFRIRPQDGWVWVIVSGVVSIALGLMIFKGLPGTGTWTIGVLVGFNILISGIVFFGIALIAPKKQEG